MVKSLWVAEQAAQYTNGLDQLVYRSNLIGADRSVCNIFGGNTSTKTIEKDFRGRDVEVMYVRAAAPIWAP